MMHARALESGFQGSTLGKSTAISQWLKSLIAAEIHVQVSDYHEDRSMLWQSLSHGLQDFKHAFSRNINIDSSGLVRATFDLGGLLQDYPQDDPRWKDESRPHMSWAHDDSIHELAHRAVHHAVYFLSLGDKVHSNETPPRGKAGNLIPKIDTRLQRRRAIGLGDDWRDSLLRAGRLLSEAVTHAVSNPEISERYAKTAIETVNKIRLALPLCTPKEVAPNLWDGSETASELADWLEKNCPTLHSLRDKTKGWPSGFVTFVSARSKGKILEDHPILAEEFGYTSDEQAFLVRLEEIGASERQEGRKQLIELESIFEELSTKTPIGANFKSLVRGASTEDKVIELLTEASVVRALCRVLDYPVLSPQIEPSQKKGQRGKNCDLRGFIFGYEIWFEIKAYSDHLPVDGEARVRALSIEGYHQKRDQEKRIERPRAWNLRNRLDGQKQIGKAPNGIPEQFRDEEINVAIINERSWDAYQHLAAALFGEKWRLQPMKHIDSPVIHSDGLFASERWKKVAAVAMVTKEAGTIGIRWFLNPNAKIPLPKDVLTELANKFKSST